MERRKCLNMRALYDRECYQSNENVYIIETLNTIDVHCTRIISMILWDYWLEETFEFR